MLNTVVHGDCLDVMKDIPDGSIDFICADLPYGTIACSWDAVIPFIPLWQQYKRIISDCGVIALHCAQPFTSALVMSNVEMFKYCWVWHKSLAADFVNAKNKPMRNHEDIAVFSRGGTANRSRVRMNYYPQGLVYAPRKKDGRKKFGNIAGSRPSHQDEYIAEYKNYPKTILVFPNKGKRLHPTQKPVALLEYLIRTYTREGELVLDNVCGSGSTCVAAINTGRNFIGIEKELKYVEISRQRIAETMGEIL